MLLLCPKLLSMYEIGTTPNFKFELCSTGVARGPANEKKNIKAILVNLTLNMRYKNDKKNIKIVITSFVFSSSKCTKIRFRPGLRPGPPGPRWWSLRRSPRPPSRLGRGIPPPHSPSRSTPAASRYSAPTAPRFSAPQHKILATPVLCSSQLLLCYIVVMKIPVSLTMNAT